MSSLSASFEQLRVAIPFHPNLAREFQLNPVSSLLFAQLWFISGKHASQETDGWFRVSQKELEAVLVVSSKTLRTARKDLVSRGMIEEQVSGTLMFRVNAAVLEDRFGEAKGTDRARGQVVPAGDSGVPDGHNEVPQGNFDASSIERKEEERIAPSPPKEQTEPHPTTDLTFDQILSGDIDHTHKKRLTACPMSILRPLLHRWAEVWGKDTSRTRMNDRRRSAWRKMVSDGVLPSEIAKAIIGMRFDDWAERPRYCDWHLVAKDADRWIELYEQNKGRQIPSGKPEDCKIIKGVRVPQDYQWTNEDDHILANGGFRFDFDSRRWVGKK